VSVRLSTTTTTFGGLKSSGIAHDAAITFERPPCALVMIVTGP
jgi:hypothetical protein